MTAKVGVASAWKTVEPPKVGVGGAWRTISRAWVGVAGAWREFYLYAVTTLTTSSSTASTTTPTTCTAQYKLLNTGVVQASSGTGSLTTRETWLLSGVVADYQARVTVTGGSPGTLSSGTAGTWTTLSTTQNWTRDSGTLNTDTNVVILVEIRRASDGYVTSSISVTLSAMRSS